MCTRNLGWYVRDYKPFTLNLFLLLPVHTARLYFSVSFEVKNGRVVPSPSCLQHPSHSSLFASERGGEGKGDPVTEFSQQKVRKKWLPLAGLVY